MSDDDDGDDGDDDADDDDDDVDDETTRPLLDISVRERNIGRMADAPVLSMELCVGDVVVPRTSVHHVTEHGAFAHVDMVDISRTGGGFRCYTWLWEPLDEPEEEPVDSKAWTAPERA